MTDPYNCYRMDYRTVEQFAEDILQGTKVERDIIERYVMYYRNKYGLEIVVEDNGCDNTGQLLEQGQVNTNADFILSGKPVEVKFNKCCQR